VLRKRNQRGKLPPSHGDGEGARRRLLDAHFWFDCQIATTFVAAIVYETETMTPEIPLTSAHKCSHECRWPRTPDGSDQERLTYRYSGRDFRLTNVHDAVQHKILA